MARSAAGIIISWFFTLLAIIVLVLLANFVAYALPNPIVLDLVAFLNGNVWLLIISSIFFYLGALFYKYGFPVNILTPPFDGVGSVFIVAFLINLVEVTDAYSGIGVGYVLKSYSFIIYIVVFILVVLLGYVAVAQRQQRVKEHKMRKERHIDNRHH
ncbi:hypothetical protein COU57_06805 [Candidatus Pacearchaeota archaeon CG10_big_fil_rev_8_21_14_0_10_32_14]|nr:MAG: hypothetical protein COU57_06805 [Candidatus Pacearchaeota archaeon CG10_big_fil_rev_8_21_14_0_10_32_14]